METAINELTEKVRTYFNIITKYAILFNKIGNKKSSSVADDIKISIAILMKCMITYVINPHEKKIDHTMMNTMDQMKLMEMHNNKIKKIYEIGHYIIDNFTLSNDLYLEKYNGEHKEFNETIDKFIVSLLPYTKGDDEDDIIKTTSSIIIYMTKVIKLGVYCTYENESVSKEAAMYLTLLINLFEEHDKR